MVIRLPTNGTGLPHLLTVNEILYICLKSGRMKLLNNINWNGGFIFGWIGQGGGTEKGTIN